MSSKEREWLEQRASYSLKTEGGMEGGMGAKVVVEEGTRGDGNWWRGHIFNRVTKGEAAWETGLCSSNPAGRFSATVENVSAVRNKRSVWCHNFETAAP